MKRYITLFAVLAFSFAGWSLLHAPYAQADDKQQTIDEVGYNPSAVAQLKQAVRHSLGERTVKDYHQKIHQNGTNCQLCHSGEAPTTPPNDDNCVRCHGSAEQIAETTAGLERNPHNSPHYGTYVPCSTCHMEHQPSKLLCADCHTFTFENFKE